MFKHRTTARNAFQALTDEALERLRTSVGKHIDPNVYESLRAVVKKRRTLVFIDPLNS